MTETLLQQAGLEQGLPDHFEESAWVEVIQRMDAIYTDLVRYQIELEEKNAELERAYSELKQAHQALQDKQQQLIQSEKMASLGRLVAGVAHELNNPISFVFANMHALLGYEERFRRYLEAVHSHIALPEREALRQKLRIDRILQDIRPLLAGSMEGAERVSEIVKNLRQFSTPASQKPESFDIVALCQRTVMWLVRSAPHKPQIDLDCPEQLVIYNYEGYVSQVLVNLIQNALDAMDGIAKPLLSVKLWQEQDKLHLTVKDNGHGIKDVDLHKLFDPFFTTKPVGKGTGLGLYISYGLITEQCRGSLSAHNYYQNGDNGAVFKLSLPVNLV
ncbi:sensor histidine kinase [Thiolinea disciformis]|uniref:sensor histidine kinase n=1 Tax=Thiolinea disciformis TaxID=125614 RepID=UPI00036A2CC3|nr:ATP-binding protein [Thiolinea disciformis]